MSNLTLTQTNATRWMRESLAASNTKLNRIRASITLLITASNKGFFSDQIFFFCFQITQPPCILIAKPVFVFCYVFNFAFFRILLISICESLWIIFWLIRTITTCSTIINNGKVMSAFPPINLLNIVFFYINCFMKRVV